MAQTDRFYNAPEGPQTEPDVELPRRAHYDISSSPNMFGGLIAQGLQEVGSKISDASNTFSQVASDQATNNFMGQLSDARSDFENTRGQDTMQQHGSYVQNVQKIFDQNRSTVPPQGLAEYDRTARRYLFNAKEGAASHLAAQSNSWAQGVAVSKDQTAMAAISANPNDEQAFQLNQEQMAKAAVNQTQLKEGISDYSSASPDAQGIIRNAYDQARARAAYARIEAVRPTNPGQALAWQQQYAPLLGKLGPEVQNQLKGYQQQQNVETAVSEANAHVAGGTAFAGGPQPKSPPDVYANIPDVDKQGRAGQVAKFQQWNPDPVGNSDKILASVHPDLQAVVKRAQADNPNLPFVVALGKTTPEQGVQAHQWGWATSDSNAGTQAHDRGEVVDLWPLNGKQQVDFDPAKQRQINTAMQKAAGELGQTLRWGGLGSEGGQNQHFRDAPNFQLLNPKPWDASAPSAPPVHPALYRQPASVQTALLGAGAAGVSVPAQYAPMVQSAGAKWGVDTAMLSRQIQQESGFNKNAKSPAGAEGISQFIPGTAAKYGVDVRDPQSSIEGQAHYMSDLQNMFGGNKGLALAGYNWGEGHVQQWLRNGADPARLPKETANYVKSITGHDLADWVQNPGIAIHTVPLGPGQSNPTVTHPGAPAPQDWGPAHQGTAGGPIIEANYRLGTQGVAPGGAADPGGSDGGQSGAGPSIQPASTGGGGGFGGQSPQSQPPEVNPPQQSPFEMTRDRTSQAMLYTMGRTDLDEHTKDQVLAEQEKQLRLATFAAEQDTATKAKFSNEAVDRSLVLAMGGNGQQANPQAGFDALTDAFKRGVIDEPAYERGSAALTKFSGQEDLRAYGPGYADIMTGKTKISSLADIQALAAHGDLTKKGYDAAKQDLTYADKGENESYLTRKKYAYAQAESYLKWEMAGASPGTSIKNPRAESMMNDFANIFENEADLYRKEDPKMKGFPLFDSKKLQAELDTIYSPRDKEKDMGQGGLSKPQADAADEAWAAAPTHTAAPAGFDQGAWQATVAAPPQTPDGFALPHAEWDLRLRTLAQSPTPQVRQFWDARYGPKGTVATGPTADAVLRELRGNVNRPGTPTPQERQEPVVYQGHLPSLPSVEFGGFHPENIINRGGGPSVHIPIPTPPEMPPAEAAPWIPGQ